MKDQRNIEENRRLYKIPSGANYQLRSKNAIYIAPNNTVKHEMSKCLGAYMLRKWGDIKFTENISQALTHLQWAVKDAMETFPKNKKSFITEAVPKKEPERRVDLVLLDDDTRIEFETNKKTEKENCVTIYI